MLRRRGQAAVFAKLVCYPLLREERMLPRDSSLLRDKLNRCTIAFWNPDMRTPYRFHGAEFTFSLAFFSVVPRVKRRRREAESGAGGAEGTRQPAGRAASSGRPLPRRPLTTKKKGHVARRRSPFPHPFFFRPRRARATWRGAERSRERDPGDAGGRGVGESQPEPTRRAGWPAQRASAAAAAAQRRKFGAGVRLGRGEELGGRARRPRPPASAPTPAAAAATITTAAIRRRRRRPKGGGDVGGAARTSAGGGGDASAGGVLHRSALGALVFLPRRRRPVAAAVGEHEEDQADAPALLVVAGRRRARHPHVVSKAHAWRAVSRCGTRCMSSASCCIATRAPVHRLDGRAAVRAAADGVSHSR